MGRLLIGAKRHDQTPELVEAFTATLNAGVCSQTRRKWPRMMMVAEKCWRRPRKAVLAPTYNKTNWGPQSCLSQNRGVKFPSYFRSEKLGNRRKFLANNPEFHLPEKHRSLALTPFAIAGMQMYVSAIESNIPGMSERLDILMLRYPWVQMVVFSELAAFGPVPTHAQTMPGPAEEAFCEMASRHGIWLIPGSMFERVGERIYNTAPVIDPRGEVVTRYRKMFPFRPYERGISGGEEFSVFDVPEVGRFGVSICYDMWFPETTRTLASMGAEVIIHPTLTDTLDREIELSISRTNAAINQCYFVDINGLGSGGYGRSIIVGPAGDVIHQATVAEEIMPIEIDLARVRRERNVGIHGLGQPLKSFRDRSVAFDVYRPDGFDFGYLHSLGPLERPDRRAIILEEIGDSTVDTGPPTEKTPN
jgi:predicted amidohydrolase